MNVNADHSISQVSKDEFMKSKTCRRRQHRPLASSGSRLSTVDCRPAEQAPRGARTLTLCASDLSPAEQRHTWLAGWASFRFLLAIKFFQGFEFFYKCFVLIFEHRHSVLEAFNVFLLFTATLSRCFAIF